VPVALVPSSLTALLTKFTGSEVESGTAPRSYAASHSARSSRALTRLRIRPSGDLEAGGATRRAVARWLLFVRDCERVGVGRRLSLTVRW
jgi:hypothetical protein